MPEPVPAIGIDLGTTYSCVGAFRNGKVQIFYNDEGKNITPSCVAFMDDKTLVGDPAKKQLILKPKNTIYDMKHLIGKCQVDDTVKNNKKYWTFEVKEEDDRPVVEIEQNGKKRLVKPEEVSALVLEKMKKVAEKVLQQKVTKAVITVPAYFNQAQKQGTIRAAQMAGLEVVNLVTEPAAAAFAYGFDNNDYTDENILVEDIGDSTFDVTVVKVKNGRFVVSAIGGDTQWGGRDFDHLLMDHFNKKIKDKHGVDCCANKRTKQKFLKECIDVKDALTAAQESSLYLSELSNELDGQIKITRAEFNKLCEPLFQKIKTITESTLTDAKVTPADIKSVLLVGGSSRIPHIEEILGQMFGGDKLNKVINAEEAVAYGAALYAQKYFEAETIKIKEKLSKMDLIEAIPLGIGVGVTEDQIDFVIPRNSIIPKEETKEYFTSVNDQREIEIKIFESASPLVADANYLGTFCVDGIKPDMAGSQKISVTFKLNCDGTLSVSSKYENRVINHKLDYSKLRARKNEVDKMVAEHNKNKDQKEGEAKRVDNMSDETPVGIDLGTTFSCVGIWRNDQVEIIANFDGLRTTPSYVSYKQNEILIGQPAQRQLSLNPSNTIYDMKRLIGNKNAHECIKRNGKYWTFKTNENSEVEVYIGGQTKRIKPEEVSAQILMKLKQSAENVIRKPIKNIVLTVPAYFDEDQKKATIKAAKIAGLHVLELISEPSAAAYAYGFDQQKFSDTNLLVFDLGGGTLDVVIVKVKDSIFNVVAIGGDICLGGRDFDNALMDYFVDIIEKKYKKKISENVKIMQKLLKEIIELKLMLSAMDEANLFLGDLFPDINENIEIDRATFDKLCFSLFHSIEMVILGTLKEADISADKIDEIILVGGSSRIPAIKELALKIFPTKKLNFGLNPDEAIAYGATLRATQIINKSIPNIKLTEANALRLQKL